MGMCYTHGVPRNRTVTTRRSRQTGSEITIGHAEDLGLDPGPNGETRWYTLCEHGSAVGHATKTLALAHAADPLGWCDACTPTGGRTAQ